MVGSDGNVGGVFVLSDSDRTLLQGNTVANDRPGDGIFVEAGSDRTVLRRNLASGNDDLGIEAVAGVTDGGGTPPAATATRPVRQRALHLTSTGPPPPLALSEPAASW